MRMTNGERIPIYITETVRGNPDIPGLVQPEVGHRYRVPRYHITLVKEAGSYFMEKKRNLLSPDEAAAFAREILTEIGTDREVMYAIGLDAKSKVIGINIVSMGSLSASIVHPREVFKALILMNAYHFMVFHNHPSEVPEPSAEDMEITRKLGDAANILGIRLLDHIIIAGDSYYSFSASGLI